MIRLNKPWLEQATRLVISGGALIVILLCAGNFLALFVVPSIREAQAERAINLYPASAFSSETMIEYTTSYTLYSHVYQTDDSVEQVESYYANDDLYLFTNREDDQWFSDIGNLNEMEQYARRDIVNIHLNGCGVDKETAPRCLSVIVATADEGSGDQVFIIISYWIWNL